MEGEVKRYLRVTDEYYRLGVELFSSGDYYDAAEKI